MRAVLDPNVLISALLAPSGAPARSLLAWRSGSFELILSPLLLAELKRALGYEKLRRLIPEGEANEVLRWLEDAATIVPDPDEPPPIHSPDPGDDYLLALASSQRAVLVSGDKHLIGVAGELPILTPVRFLEFLDEAL